MFEWYHFEDNRYEAVVRTTDFRALAVEESRSGRDKSSLVKAPRDGVSF